MQAKEDLDDFSLNIWDGRQSQSGDNVDADDDFDGDIKFIVTTSSSSPNNDSTGDRTSSSPRTFGIGPL